MNAPGAPLLVVRAETVDEMRALGLREDFSEAALAVMSLNK